jgi:site-specific recombinase XerD
MSEQNKICVQYYSRLSGVPLRAKTMSTQSHKDDTTEPKVTFEDAWERYQEEKRTDPEHSNGSIEAYRYGVRKFLSWSDEHNHTPESLDEWDVGKFTTWLTKTHDLEPTTIASYTKAVKQLLKYCNTMGLIEESVVEGHSVRTASKSERQWDKEIDRDRAEKIMEYLQREYSGRRNTVIFTILLRTGMRLSGLRAIDIEDIEYSEDTGARIHLQERGEGTSGANTTLKGGRSHERFINIKQETFEEIQHYVSEHRKDVDDDGRKPLLTTRFGRIGPSAIQENIYKVTCPNHTGIGDCSCTGITTTKNASDCEMSVSPHTLRGCHVTNLLDNGWTFEQISGRVGAKAETLRAHYDKSTKAEEANRRKSLVDDL